VTANVRHSNASSEWGSPDAFVRIARATLGEIDVDPFTSTYWNTAGEATIDAKRIGTVDGPVDGFSDRWLDEAEAPRADWILGDVMICERAVRGNTTAFVNPPSDDGEPTVRGMTAVKRAWQIAETYHRLGWLDGGAIWVGFNLNQLQTLQFNTDGDRRIRSPLHADFLRVVPRRRVPYRPHPSRASKVQAPSHPSFLLLMPSLYTVESKRQLRTFTDLGAELGDVF
jgi:hypothetical protein